MTSGRRAAQPDPCTASDQAEFRARLRDLLRWAGYTSLAQLKAGATRRGTSMPVATANRALNNDGLPTAEFVERIAVACGADVKKWLAARDVLADRPYLRQVTCAETTPDADAVSQADVVPDICPYPGLAAFGLHEAQWFFGREKVVAEVLDLLVERLRGTGPLMIAGPSGTGKSSLLRAGLLPALSEGRLAGSRKWAQLVFTPTADPVGQLATQVAAHLHTDPEVLTSELLSNPGHLADVFRSMSVAGSDRHDGDRVGAVLIVDQFEDVFTLCSDEQRRHVFISALCAAVERPAQAVGLELQPGLVDVMLGELGIGAEATGEPGHQPGALPLLAHALLATWQHRDGWVLTVEGYRLTGGITGAVAKTAERVYQRLNPDHHELARTVLLRMIQLGDGSADTRRQVDRARLVGESSDPAGVEAVLETLTEARLVTAHEATVEIVHEALLRAWPRLRSWIDSDRAGLLLEQRLVAAAEAWDREGRHDSDLYRGLRLASVRERVSAVDPALPSPAREFLRASIERDRAEQQGLLRRARRLRQLVAVFSCLVLIAATTTALAVQSSNTLADRDNESVSREVAGVAAALRVSDPDLAAQLAVAAYQIADTAEARGALMTALVNLDLERRSDFGSAEAVQAVAFSNNGQFLVAASRDRLARVWAIGNPPSLAAPPIAYLEHPGQVRSAVFDPTDRVLVTSGADGLVRMWPVEGLKQSNEPIRSLPGPTGDRGPLAFSPDGSILAAGGTSGTTVRLWNVSNLTDPRMDAEFVAHQGDVVAVAFRADGRTLATAGRDGSAKLWDITNRASPTELADFDRGAGGLTVAFSPHGELLAIGNGDDGTVTLWDVKDPRQPREMRPFSGYLDGGVAGVVFSRDSTTLAVASYDNMARLWNVSDPAHPVLKATLGGDADNLYSVAFHRDGYLATSSHGRTVRLWETDVDRAAAEICKLASGAITRDQWDFYLRGYEYAPPCSPPAGADLGGAEVRTQPGSTWLVAAHSDKCVAIKGGVTVPEAPAYQVTCTRTAGGKWNLQRRAVPRPDGGVAYHIRSASSGMCLDSLDSERRVGAASVIVQRPCVEDSASQLWKFEVTGRHADMTDGKFVNIEHGQCLDVNGGAITDGAPTIRWLCGNGLNQVFQVSTDAVGR